MYSPVWVSPNGMLKIRPIRVDLSILERPVFRRNPNGRKERIFEDRLYQNQHRRSEYSEAGGLDERSWRRSSLH